MNNFIRDNFIREDISGREYIDSTELTSGLIFIRSNDPFNKTISLLNKLEYNIIGYYYKDTSKTKPVWKIQTITLTHAEQTIKIIPWDNLEDVLNTSYVIEIMVREVEKEKYNRFRYILSQNLFNTYTLNQYITYIFFEEDNIYKRFLYPILSNLDTNISESDELFFKKDDLHQLNINHLRKPVYVRLKNKDNRTITNKTFFTSLFNKISEYYLSVVNDNSLFLKLKNKTIKQLQVDPILDYVLNIVVQNWNKLIEELNSSMNREQILLLEISKYLRAIMDNLNELYKKLTQDTECIKYNVDILCEVPYIDFLYEDIPRKQIQNKIKEDNTMSLVLNICYKVIDFIDFLKDGFSVKRMSVNIMDHKVRIINNRLNDILEKASTNRDKCLFDLRLPSAYKTNMSVICINNDSRINLNNLRSNIENMKLLTEKSNGVIININLLLQLYNKVAVDNGIATIEEIQQLGSKSAIISVTNTSNVFLPHDPYLDNVKVILRSGNKVSLALSNPDLSNLSLSQLREILAFFNRTCKDKYELQAKIVEEIASRHS